MSEACELFLVIVGIAISKFQVREIVFKLVRLILCCTHMMMECFERHIGTTRIIERCYFHEASYVALTPGNIIHPNINFPMHWLALSARLANHQYD